MITPVNFRPAQRGDGARLWQLVQASGALELNSAYFYITFAEFFGDTCLLAEQNGECIGCVIAFRAPRSRQELFVWQICVAPAARRQGIGLRMLNELLLMPACRDIRYLLATVTPDNVASRQMFRSFADELRVAGTYSDFYNSELFPVPHEAEKLYRIGPLPGEMPSL